MDFDVEGGEFFGFFWSNYGIVAYNWTDKDENDDSYNQNYCGDTDKPEVGEMVDLDWSPASNEDSWTHRDYAIWFHWCGKYLYLSDYFPKDDTDEVYMVIFVHSVK